MANSSQPVYPGAQFPDWRSPMTKSEVPDASLPQLLGGRQLNRNDPYNVLPLTTPFLGQHLQATDFAPLRRIIINNAEKLDGWQFAAAPPKLSEYNQTVEVVNYPRVAMPELPEDVPAPLLQHTKEVFQTMMDHFKIQFEMEAEFFFLAGPAAKEASANYAATAIGAMNMSWKAKITWSFMNVRQNQWQKASKVDNAKSMSDIANWELTSYCALDRKEKGFPTVMTYVRQLTKQQNFEFNLAVVPYGKLDKIAANAFFSETWRAGPDAIQLLFQGGKKLASLVEGITFYEDAKVSYKTNKVHEEEAFVYRVKRGGWCYNVGSHDCGDDDDPNCKYGFQFITKGNKNWNTFKFLDLVRMSGRYGPHGDLDPFIYTLCDNWEDICRAAGVYPVDGKLDPMAYRIDSRYANDERTQTRYAPAFRFGEVDVHYSPLDHIRTHVRRMHCLIREKMTGEEITALNRLEGHKSILQDVAEFPMSEQQEGFLAAVAMQNSADAFSYANNTYNVVFENLSVFLDMEPLTKAPKKIPKISRVPPEIPDFIKKGSTHCLLIELKGVEHIVLTMRLDRYFGDGVKRGEEGRVVNYVAIPVGVFTAGRVDRYNAEVTAGRRSNAWDAFFNRTFARPNTNSVGLGGDTNSYVSPEQYQSGAVRVANEADLVWTFRSSNDLETGLQNSATVADSESNEFFYDGHNMKTSIPTQGFKDITVTPPPEVPHFYGCINGLRYLANLKRSSNNYGWNQSMIDQIHDGVKALDKLFNLLLNIYTPKNMYFDPKLVPFHIKTPDEEMNRLNTAISGLWGSQDQPFLCRRPMRYKSAAGMMVFPRTFQDWTDASNTKTGWYRNLTNILNERFGYAYDPDNVILTAEDYYAHEGEVGTHAKPFAVVAAFSALLESGILDGQVRDVLTNNGRWNEFVGDYMSSTASTNYSNYLKEHKKFAIGGIPVPDLRKFSTFFDFELREYLENAANTLMSYFKSAGGAAIDADDRTEHSKRETSRISEEKIKAIASNLHLFGYMLSCLIKLWMDDSKMDYNLNYVYLKNRKAAAKDSFTALSTSKGRSEVDVMADSLRNSIKGVKLATGGAAPNSVGSMTSQYWVNTGLTVNTNLWKRWQNEINSLEKRIAVGDNELVYELEYAYNTPLRPMMGQDHGKPISGESITESTFWFRGAADKARNYIRAAAENISQAMTKKSSTDMMDRKSTTGGSRDTGRFNVEELARGISNSRFEQHSKRNVPAEFLTRDPYKMTGGESIRRPDAYLTGVRVQTDSHHTIETGVEPQHLKFRLNEINNFYKDDTISRIVAHLWCFSPFHFDVISNMVNNKVTPAGRGHIMLRWCQEDRVGAMLFSVASRDVAESGYNCTLSSGAFNQQNNKINVVFSAMLGCTIYQQDKVLWLRSQTMHGNVSGMGAEMYIDPQNFDVTKAQRPDKDGFIIYVGDNLDMDTIKPCISITSKYNSQRYGPLVSNKAILESPEQHVPGLLWLIGKFRLYELNGLVYNLKSTFYEEKVTNSVNLDCYKEDHRQWDSASKSYSTRIIGNWHLSRLTPDDAEFLDGQATNNIRETNFGGLRF